ncbi:monovalent cation/H+ antiporter subunit D family protein [Motiliproteus sp. SC1-56]|uniref:monovalent cation/H+ antiporter subunit D family protein n=1 Tax=Motiliproteus sp. SC1-56 TaxID=2799565 RepID=UPI001A8E9AB0|nr:monovalent cation/H+ antiporter subunit D family protein [Motiliproteus sp. SC1-56]
MNAPGPLAVLVVIMPLLAAPLCVLIGRIAVARWLALLVGWASAAMALTLLAVVEANGPLSYALGDWAPPWGIEYRLDRLGSYVLLIVTLITALVFSFAPRSVDREIPEGRQIPFYSALLLAAAGLNGIVVTGDAFNLFVFLEISSLASYALISQGYDRRALYASFRYLMMGTIGATFILIGIGFLYMMTGTLNMQDLAQRLPAVFDTRTVRAGFAFLTVGIGLKLAIFPLHLWLPNAYAFAPAVVSALLAATSTKVAVYVMLRFTYDVFGQEFAFVRMPLGSILMLLGAVGIVSASLVAVFQDNVKRMLAYSSVAQLGYMALAMGLANRTGVTAALLHLFNHALMKGALFLALGALSYRVGTLRIGSLAGLGRRMPWSSAALVIGGLSLVGVPPTAGFISKWYLILGALESGWWPLALLILAGSLLALVYVWRLVEAAYFARPLPGPTEVSEAPLTLLLPVWALVLANLYFGLNTSLTVGIAQRAAAQLTGAGP